MPPGTSGVARLGSTTVKASCYEDTLAIEAEKETLMGEVVNQQVYIDFANKSKDEIERIQFDQSGVDNGGFRDAALEKSFVRKRDQLSLIEAIRVGRTMRLAASTQKRGQLSPR